MADGTRTTKSRVRTAKGRKLSSTLWLERQLNDPYVQRAKREGYRSRAAYKILEMHDALKLFKPGQIVVDLGAAPGGWSQVAADKTKAREGKGMVIALDYLDITPIPGVTLLKEDFTSDEGERALIAMLDGKKADLVLSDMAAPTTGHTPTDHLRILALCDLAFAFACAHLAPGGAFLAKILQGGTEKELLTAMKLSFAKVKHIKPKASRKDSAEMYVVATGFRGGKKAEE